MHVIGVYGPSCCHFATGGVYSLDPGNSATVGPISHPTFHLTGNLIKVHNWWLSIKTTLYHLKIAHPSPGIIGDVVVITCQKLVLQASRFFSFVYNMQAFVYVVTASLMPCYLKRGAQSASNIACDS